MKSTTEPIPELGNRTWEELEVVTHSDGHLLFKDAIRKRLPTGKLELQEVRVRVVRGMELVQARAETRVMFAQIKGLDQDRDKDTFDELEQYCILSHAIRTKEAPYGQLATTQELLSDYDEASLKDISARIQCIKGLIDPRETELTRDRIWGAIDAVRRVGNLLPLTDIAGHEHPSLIVYMACQAMNSPMGVAWSQSRENSTPARSAEQSSIESSEASQK